MPVSQTAAGAALALSAGIPATQDQTGFAALTYTEVGGIEKIGTIGVTFPQVDFTPLKGAMETHKGTPDYGALQPTLARNDADAGQTLMKTAANHQTATYAFKITLADGAIFYFQGKVFGFPTTIDNSNSIVKVDPTIKINTKPIEVPAS